MLYSPREEGQGLAEYGMIITLVAIVVVAAAMLLGPQVAAMFEELSNSLENFM